MMNISRQIFSAALGLLPVLTELLCFCVTSRQNILQLYLGSFLCYLTGFILWNLDNHTCPTLQYIRAALPTFLRPFIQVLLLYISDLFVLTHSQVFFLQIFLPIFSNKIKNDMPTGATFENKSPLMDEQILFSLHFRTDNGDQFHPVLSTCNVSFPSIHL